MVVVLRMSVEEGGDGEAIGGGVSSIIHQPVRLIYLPPQGAERDLPSGSARSHFHLSFFSASVLLLLRMDECEHAARKPAHPSPQHWQRRLPSASLSDAARRLRAGTRPGAAALRVWLQFWEPRLLLIVPIWTLFKMLFISQFMFKRISLKKENWHLLL